MISHRRVNPQHSSQSGSVPMSEKGCAFRSRFQESPVAFVDPGEGIRLDPHRLPEAFAAYRQCGFEVHHYINPPICPVPNVLLGPLEQFILKDWCIACRVSSFAAAIALCI